ncbi:hypothetical protein AMAG_19161 [Allomyces macrogynus ATCC 38327]|uniref:Uncharacterized protein n=1 Tax=Allomyces macrogynus (strain ATCC 38327) TaxID=578462 RepID=A0A0L0SQ46_ALLM3|nr:hypothetical protein AMAG_19161 [Allomyces macrogynus ATCC 38327]|eukprot:KNE64460.1 hypothetical protein AMAG_19161 [Allomyces macrogynus ATCC 38327]
MGTTIAASEPAFSTATQDSSVSDLPGPIAGALHESILAVSFARSERASQLAPWLTGHGRARRRCADLGRTIGACCLYADAFFPRSWSALTSLCFRPNRPTDSSSACASSSPFRKPAQQHARSRPRLLSGCLRFGRGPRWSSRTGTHG